VRAGAGRALVLKGEPGIGKSALLDHAVGLAGQGMRALEIFQRTGAKLWASRAQAELRATGDRSLTRVPESGLIDQLTPQELQVVRLAATGATNRDIGAQMFLSPRTVAQHLYRAFPKLGITTRTELAALNLDL
jgi:DNA-binding NarL/FixJ family response regulator